jgi:hypothetical protein
MSTEVRHFDEFELASSASPLELLCLLVDRCGRDSRSSFHTTRNIALTELIQKMVQLGPVPAVARCLFTIDTLVFRRFQGGYLRRRERSRSALCKRIANDSKSNTSLQRERAIKY